MFDFDDGINDHGFNEDVINERLDKELAFNYGIDVIDLIDYMTR